MRQIILDTETTGLSPQKGDRLIEIGCLEMVDRHLTGEKFHVYLNPQCEVPEGAVAIHGITTEFLKDKPLFHEVADSFVDFIDGAELIIHNAPFDVSFLNFELRRCKHAVGSVEEIATVFDTLALARNKHPGQRNNLDALCKRYGLANSQRTLHGALLDAELLAAVYLKMTAGQSSLLLDTEILQAVQKRQLVKSSFVVKRVQRSGEPLRIIKATPGELDAHEQYFS